MKIVFICTNYSSYEDGIGHYTYNLKMEIEKNNYVKTDIIYGYTIGYNSIDKLKSKSMIDSINKFIKQEKNNIDRNTYFVIEYPFLEWNPFILKSILKLKGICNKKGCKLILSIHEYKRVNRLRRYFTNLLIRICDAMMVTDIETYNSLLKYNKPIEIRSIPSNILATKECKKEENLFCYFGLVNKSKSFDEMINAWKKFNINGKYKLNIYTSTNIEIQDMDMYNIYYYKKLDDYELSKELWKCKYAILPINPYIDLNNGTIKTIAQHKCIPIGIFKSDELSELGINIEDTEYTINNLFKAYNEAIELDKKEFDAKVKKLEQFGNKFSFKQNSKVLTNFIKNI